MGVAINREVEFGVERLYWRLLVLFSTRCPLGGSRSDKNNTDMSMISVPAESTSALAIALLRIPK